MSEPTTSTGKRLNVLLGECDIRWPDEYTRFASSVWGEHIVAIEREACEPTDEGHWFTVDSLAAALQADTSTLNLMMRRSGRPNVVFWEQEAGRIIKAAKEAERETE